ncbi:MULTISPECIES: DKNYY domain-containing protein [Pseudomonas]|uniref:Uncharacterized protein n=4 Tax=Pseudomonas TaxID=286 RepID=A0A3M4IY27_PSEVI|nr:MULTISPECIES: DKNYY domain-containing protein [Pseudomonas]RMO95201.1 hypothetical protein ALQ30_01674 [Pseudomonas syringae pv. persicae]RMQ09712.1 hypothetical protein ALQ09_01148 [Pseudomonas viridiflava]RMQ72181.1 hypothetical protein ALP98_01433 [Pseudomonas viridiflava]
MYVRPGRRLLIIAGGLAVLGFVGHAVYEALPGDMGNDHINVVCEEVVSGRFNGDGTIDDSKKKTQKCSSDLRTLSAHYVVLDDDVYWMNQVRYKEKPCITGAGDASGAISNFSFSCLLSKQGQINSIETRELNLVAHYSPSFKPLEGSLQGIADWQTDQLAYYAKDDISVYYGGRKIKGADPHLFSVVFPLGDDKKWRSLSVSMSGNEMFVGGLSIGDIDLYDFRPLIPVDCPEHGISECAGRRELEDFLKYDNWGQGLLGVVGNDLVFLHTSGAERFADMASSDTFMFATSKKIYVYTKAKFYELGGEYSFNKKLVPMDVNDFTNNRG